MACEHKGLVDLSQGLGEDRHYYCRKCGYHKYRGVEFTKKEWDFYVNDFSDSLLNEMMKPKTDDETRPKMILY